MRLPKLARRNGHGCGPAQNCADPAQQRRGCGGTRCWHRSPRLLLRDGGAVSVSQPPELSLGLRNHSSQ